MRSSLNGMNWAHYSFSEVDWGDSCIDNIWSTKIYNYVSAKCQESHKPILYLDSLRSSGQTADSISVWLLLSVRKLIDWTRFLNLASASGASLYSLSSATWATSMCPTSQNDRTPTISKSSIKKKLNFITNDIKIPNFIN